MYMLWIFHYFHCRALLLMEKWNYWRLPLQSWRVRLVNVAVMSQTHLLEVRNSVYIIYIFHSSTFLFCWLHCKGVLLVLIARYYCPAVYMVVIINDVYESFYHTSILYYKKVLLLFLVLESWYWCSSIAIIINHQLIINNYYVLWYVLCVINY